MKIFHEKYAVLRTLRINSENFSTFQHILQII